MYPTCAPFLPGDEFVMDIRRHMQFLGDTRRRGFIFRIILPLIAVIALLYAWVALAHFAFVFRTLRVILR